MWLHFQFLNNLQLESHYENLIQFLENLGKEKNYGSQWCNKEE